MNKFGLYAVDATETLDLTGYTHNRNAWKRTKLIYNGDEACITGNEDNSFGTYVDNNNLVCNGEIISRNSNSSALEAVAVGIRFGDAPVIYPNHCISITKANYTRLRNNEIVPGYSKYNYHSVYNIAEQSSIDNSNPIEIVNRTTTEDVLYNSESNELTENSLDNSTFTNIDCPTLVVRSFNFEVKVGSPLEFNYFVDTKYQDSINKGLIDDTFTTIVTDSFGREIFKKTTYAGEHKVVTSPFFDADGITPLVGETSFSIRCVDNHHVGSIEYFYHIIIKEFTTEELIADNESIYKMTANDLQTYGISINSGRDNLIAGRNNRIGFCNLFADVIARGYKGVRLYNENTNASKSWEDSNNSCYYIDNHEFIDESTPAGFKKYYIVRYDADSGNLYTVDGNQLTFPSKTGIRNFSAYLPLVVNYFETAQFNNFEIKSGQSITINGITYDDIDEPYSWIKRDGAHIYRDEFNKILVPWTHDTGPEEHPFSISNESVFTTSHILRIKPIQFIAQRYYYKGSISDCFKEGSGYYYIDLYYGTSSIYNNSTFLNTAEPFNIPNNFIIDGNYTTWRSTNATDLAISYKVLLELSCNTDTHFYNLNIVGDWTPETIKDAYLRQNRVSGNGPWEHCGNVSLGSSRFVTFSNVQISGSAGYELSCGAANASATCKATTNSAPSGANSAIPMNRYGYINITTGGNYSPGDLISDNTAVVKKDGISLTSTLYSARIDPEVDYDNSEICLVTSDELIDITNIGVTYKSNMKTYTRQNGATLLDKDYSYEIKLGGILSNSFSQGKYHEFFIHFFEEVEENGNIVVKYKNTVKTRHYLSVIPPRGAKYMLITGYGLCNKNNYELLKNSAGSTRNLCTITLTALVNTEGIIFDNCYFHDTRTIALNGPYINTTIINCLFERICASPTLSDVTKKLADIEENGLRVNTLSLINSKCIVRRETPANYNNDQSKLGDMVGWLYMKNCVGFGLRLKLIECWIEDSKLSGFSSLGQGGITNIFKQRLKRCHCTNEFQLYKKQTSQMNHAYSTVSNPRRNACDEPVYNEINLRDCFINELTSYSDSSFTKIIPSAVASNIKDVYYEQFNINN